MNNIFENAYFGKPYKIRDGRKAIYLKCSKETHRLILEDSSVIWSKNDGKTYNGILESSCYDIVSEWQEEINEKELDKLAKDTKQYDDKDKILYKAHGEFYEAKDLDVVFKAGYRKALKQ